jgi:arsenical pump membrane protein
MELIQHQLVALFPALAFLIFGVPLAVLLDRLNFFRACADIILHRNPSYLKLWVLAACTTAVLNLDTTIVLLTPLYVHIAKKAKVDPLPVVVIPLLLACFASSLLPVSNLTNLIAASSFDVSSFDFLRYLGVPTLVAVIVGWFLYRRRFPHELKVVPLDKEPDMRALRIGGVVVAGVLIGFVFGHYIGLAAWMVALIADIVLIAILRWIPWRSVPLKTAVIVAIVGCVAVLAIPAELLRGMFSVDPTAQTLLGAMGLSTLLANSINNLPTILIGVHSSEAPSWGLWAWLIGVNVGAVLLPIGALANLLWKGIVTQNGIPVSFRQYLSFSLPIGVPTLLAAGLTLLLEFWWFS